MTARDGAWKQRIIPGIFIIMVDHKAILNKYLPQESVDMVISMLKNYKVHLRISRGRTTRLGDFRPPVNGCPGKVSVNNNMNKYAFLVTLIHEIAHVSVWDKHKNRVKPHGREWKNAYARLMMPFIENDIFPGELLTPLISYLRNPKASSVADRKLHKALKAYDDKETVFLEEIPENGLFMLNSGKLFRKMKKIRTRYRCLCHDNQKVYLVNGLAEVVPVNAEK